MSTTNTPFASLPPNDPVYEHLAPEMQQMSAPNLENAGFWVLLWAAIRTLLGSFTRLLGWQERSTLATEQLANAVQTYTNRSVHRKPLKLDSPEPFNGQPDKVEAFLNALTLYFSGQQIRADDQRVIFALSLVKGGTGDIAGSWANLQRKLIVEFSNNAENNGHIGTWAQFVTDFTAYFQYSSSKDEAQMKLVKLQQGKSTADEYITLFKGLAPSSGFNDEALLDHFKRGLNTPLRTVVFNIRPQPVTYKDWLREASECDRTYRKAKEYNSALGGRVERETVQQKAKMPAVQAAPRVERDPDAMDVDRLRDIHTCYKCGKPGHIARFCPNGPPPKFNVRAMAKDDVAELLRAIHDLPDFQERQE